MPAEIVALLEDDQAPHSGSIFIGTEGVMLLPHIAKPSLYPDAKFKDFKYQTIEEVNHWGEFVDACLGEGKTSANFGYAGPLTEAVLLGGVASHFPHTAVEWNPKKMTFKQSEANQYVRREYRPGWSVKGLS